MRPHQLFETLANLRARPVESWFLLLGPGQQLARLELGPEDPGSRTQPERAFQLRLGAFCHFREGSPRRL